MSTHHSEEATMPRHNSVNNHVGAFSANKNKIEINDKILKMKAESDHVSLCSFKSKSSIFLDFQGSGGPKLFTRIAQKK